MPSTRPICDGFLDVGDQTYLIAVYTTDDGQPEDYSISLLLGDGSTVPYEPSEDETEKFQVRAQEIYDGYVEASWEM